MRLLEEAGLPPGVINMVPGDGIPVSEVALADRDLAGIHFTGSTAGLPAPVADGRGEHRELPRLPADRRRDRRQGLRRRARLGRRRRAAHRDDPGRLRVPGPEVLGGLARLRAAQRLGAGCATTWSPQTEALSMGDVTDFSNFMGAVIDRKSFSRLSGVLDRAKDDDALTVVAGGTADDSEGFFVRPTIIEGTDPGHEVFSTEYFGPVLAVHVYDDADYDAVLAQMESVAPVRADRRGHRPGPGRDRARPALPAQRGGQLLRQRQADRRRRRPAAVRRRAGLGHQRQGRRPAEPAALDEHPLDQGDVRAGRPTTATRTWAELPRPGSRIIVGVPGRRSWPP